MTDDDRRLAERLRRYEASVPETPLPTTTTFSGRPPWIGIAAVGAAAVLAGAFIAGNLLDGPPNVGETDASPTASAEPTPSVSPSPSASPEPTSSPTSDPETPASTPAPQAGISGVAWSDDPSATLDGEIFRVTADGGRFYALGRTDDHAAIWSSTDGASWQRVDFPDPAGRGEGFVYVDELVTVGAELLAIGTTGLNDSLNVVVWTSADGGATWSEIDTGGFDTAAYNIHDVTNGPDGLVAFGHEFGAGTGSAWRSGNAGRTWTEHQLPGEGIGLGVSVGTGRGYLIGGMVGEDTDAPSPRIWYSNDAMTWTQASLEGSDGRGQVEQLTIDGSGRWVATGVLEDRIVVWRSTDRGLSWTLAADLGAVGPSGHGGFLLAGAPDGFIVFSATDPAQTWTSADGIGWSAGPSTTFDPADGTFIGWARGIARIGDTLVVAGSRSDPNGSDHGHHTWIGEIQR